MNISNTKFDFDDILIMPSVSSDITSRYKDVILPDRLPLFTAPMDTVVNLDNFDFFLENKINVTLPRTVKYPDYLKYSSNYYYNRAVFESIFISLGFEEVDYHIKYEKLQHFQPNTHILIDVANGHMKKIVEYANKIKNIRPDIKIMVGNIANPQTYTWYAEQDCVDYIRVGIGNGGGCLTTKQSGVGHPMASLIHEVYLEKQKFISQKVPAIVADGGMKDYSDIIKALALGADYVMVGSIFNKSLESCADNYLYGIKINRKLAGYLFDKGFPIKKYFRGMSTKGAQKAMGKNTFKTSEGVVRFRKVEYRLEGWVENFEHYLRNAMSYANAETLDEFIGKVEICQISKSAYDRFNK
jgi:IMP dehydrogenase/GMP reductase